jgi:TolB-like protein
MQTMLKTGRPHKRLEVAKQDPKKGLRLILTGRICLLSIFFVLGNALADEPWYKSYSYGLEAMERGDWKTAIGHFDAALAQKNKDSGKVRAYGAVFIQYYPNRERGICYYFHGDMERARADLTLSLQQSSSLRAREYLNKISGGVKPSAPPKVEKSVEPPPSIPSTPTRLPATVEPPAATVVGERLTIAILPFDTKGIGGDLGEIDLLDKLTTAFYNMNRFKVIERAQLEQILNEQKLGMSGIVDVSTAAQIGKGMGVDAVVCGSIARAGNTASIDARLVDTETAAIITAQDAYANGINLPALSQMIVEVAVKIKNELPLETGYVIGVDNDRITLDLGRTKGMRKGMKCLVYREGAPIVHPVTNEVIGKMINELCEVQFNEIFDGYSVGLITKPKGGAPSIRDRVVTK